MLNCVCIDQLDIDSIELSYHQQPASLHTKLSSDIEDTFCSSFAFLSPKARSIAHNKSFISSFDESLYTKYKSKIIEDRLTSNKKLHLQFKEQDEAIMNMREQIENKSIMSFQSMSESEGGLEVSRTLAKLRRIEENFLERKNGKGKNGDGKRERYRIERRVLPVEDKQNLEVLKEIEFTKQQLQNLKTLSPQLQSKIKILQDSHLALPKLQQSHNITQRLQINNRLHLKQISSLTHQISTLQSEITVLLQTNQSLTFSNQELTINTEKLIQQERFKCLYEIDHEYSKQQQQLQKIIV